MEKINAEYTFKSYPILVNLQFIIEKKNHFNQKSLK